MGILFKGVSLMGNELCGIYLITSPSGKVYVGQSVNIKLRWRKYLTNPSSEQTRLYNSFKKYGVEGHTFEIVEECDIEQLNERERHWQDFYNVLSKVGLNCKLTETKDKSGKLSQETKDKIGFANKGKKGNIGIKNPMYGIPSPMTGKKHTEEAKAKISKANSGENHWTKFKVVPEETKVKISKALKGMFVGSKNPMWGKCGEHHHNFGKKLSDATKKKISEANKGKVVSADTRKKIGEAHKGKHVSQETKTKISQANKGKVRTWETKVKQSLSKIGKTLSEEEKHKRLEKMKIVGTYKIKKGKDCYFYGKEPWNKGKTGYTLPSRGRLNTDLSKINISEGVRKQEGFEKYLIINKETGIFYDCPADAERSANMSRCTLSRKLRGDRKNNTPFEYCNQEVSSAKSNIFLLL